MATSSCKKSAVEINASALQLSVSDSDDTECPLRSPSVRDYIASFELQQCRQHRQLCRTDGVGKQQQRYHDRPQPPCKTTKAVLKARHLRAASEDLSRSWKSTDDDLEIAVTDRPTAELEMAPRNCAKLTSGQNGRTHDPSDDDINFRFAGDRNEPTSRCQEHSVSTTSECDENESDRSPLRGAGTRTKHTSSGITVIPDTSVECLPRHCSSEFDRDEQPSQPATHGGVDVLDSAVDDGGYFSLPGRRAADRDRHQTARNRSHSWHLRHNSAAVDDDQLESSRTSSSDSPTSFSPSSRTNRTTQADVFSCLSDCPVDDEHCQNRQHHIGASSPTVDCSSDCIVSDNCLPTSDAAAYTQQSDKLETRDDDTKTRVEYHPVVSWRNSGSAAKSKPEKLSEMMTASFGRCDEVLCRAVDAAYSYKTAVNYVSSLFPESGLVRQCAFDLTHSCQLDATSTGIQFLTLEAVRVCSVSLLSLEFSLSPAFKIA